MFLCGCCRHALLFYPRVGEWWVIVTTDHWLSLFFGAREILGDASANLWICTCSTYELVRETKKSTEPWFVHKMKGGLPALKALAAAHRQGSFMDINLCRLSQSARVVLLFCLHGGDEWMAATIFGLNCAKFKVHITRILWIMLYNVYYYACTGERRRSRRSHALYFHHIWWQFKFPSPEKLSSI